MKKISILLVVVFQLVQAAAQVDPHFSQYYAYPLALNPAMTGAFDGRIRVTGIYRSQWQSITNPFVTSGLSADVTTGKNINVGINFFNQSAGDAGYRLLNGTLSLAYTGLKFGVDDNQQVILAMQGGFISRQFDRTKFQFGDQWTAAGGFNPNTPTADLVSKTSASSFDAGAGVFYLDRTTEKTANLFAGFSAIHLTQPYDPFLSGNKAYLPVRYAFHAGARINISETATVTPNILYMRQGNAEERMIGASAALTVNEETELLFGANYRVMDAVAPFAGIKFQKFTLGLSYDSNISNLGKIAGSSNSFELSLTFIAPKDEYKGIPCPRF